MAAKSVMNNMFLVLVIMSIILSIGLARAQNLNGLRMSARDAITLAAAEISYTHRFINSIPLLSTVRAAMPDQVALRSCVVGLVESLREANTALQRMRQHLSVATVPFFESDSDALRSAVASRIASFGNVCQLGLENVDQSTIMQILNRRLEDVLMLSTNVLNHVSEINPSN